jgi:hypothetical protein
VFILVCRGLVASTGNLLKRRRRRKKKKKKDASRLILR